ncbi:MAG: DNA-directed RNA polymerase subunit beta' [Patescibacteria group bacterium]|jgi:DNA-directed RNA polymerase subunit beta'
MTPDITPQIDFTALRLRLASPHTILDWSHGEVLKPETVNYRTQKPEKDGLFCERIFGPTKDWECYCGKYKKIRYKGIVCDKCGVEVTRSIVRRERMGHIKLASPVSHIWFLRGVPSKIGMVLDLSIQDLEKVNYFASFVITKVDDALRQETLQQLEVEYTGKKKSIEAEFNKEVNEIKLRKMAEIQKAGDADKKKLETEMRDELAANSAFRDEKLKTLKDAVDLAKKELEDLKPMRIISEQIYQDLSLKYGHVFEAGIGADALHQLLAEIDLKKRVKELEEEVVTAAENRKRRIVRLLKLLRNFDANGIRPEHMILTMIPVIPPDLRPMVQLDGGRFAASDLNDLYRRVINRNNRLKRLLELNAPEVICRNERRMLQEAVDALIDNNARHGKTVTASTGQKRMLKSIADILKGKQGRFRQNLLGKRVDYSGRSVIVVGPHLKLNECGLPKTMALELFKPFIISKLIQRELVHNVRSASRFIESERPEVWDILEEVTLGSHVLLNRAPTLHRLGIQAFTPVLIEGKAIQIHPLVCPAFNADFDGDQMAVHVPLTEKAKWEAKEIMLSSKNLLKPATGKPVVSPSQDIVLGCYYLTSLATRDEKASMKGFSSVDEAMSSFHQNFVHIQQLVKVKMGNAVVETSVGRLIFNDILPPELRFVNETMDKKKLSDLVSRSLSQFGPEPTVQLVDRIKDTSFQFLTRSGISWGMDDLTLPKEKKVAIEGAQKKVDEITAHFEAGLLTDQERHSKVIEVWAQVKDQVQKFSKDALNKKGSVYAMIESGSRGSWAQITQMMGMKGLVTNPAGDTIELPVMGSFKEGFDVLEYFISTHGARKGLSDTALRTANAGYLTRRLVDVAQDMVVTDEDCKDTDGFTITAAESAEMDESIINRIVGRVLAKDIVHPKTHKVILKAGDVVTEDHREAIEKAPLEAVVVRSVLSCKSTYGLCQSCYGYDLGFNKLVKLGTAVGVIAAQSIGEPGTQLTMRTFHTGGVAGKDITQGLPRVEELFEARPVKRPAIISEADGTVQITEAENNQRLVTLTYTHLNAEKYEFPGNKKKLEIQVKDKQTVKAGATLFINGDQTIVSKTAGKVRVTDESIEINSEAEKTKEYLVPSDRFILVKNGDLVVKGQSLTEGSLDLHQLYYLKGQEAVQKYVMKDIQYIYSSQGQKLNDKHIEIIVHQMFSRVYITDAGDTHFFSGEVIERGQFVAANQKAKKEKTKPAEGEVLLLGITKASLSIDSFLSAASFQETARVLIDAAVTGKVDNLRGLKENVIIGKLIPAGTGYRPVEAK